MNRYALPVAALMILLLVSCLQQPPPAPGVLGTSAARTAQGVAFQPPIGKGEVLTGNFRGGLHLSIGIVRLDTNQRIASFSTIDGSVTETNEPGLREHYQADWDSRRARLPDNTIVRVEVRLGDLPADAPSCSEQVLGQATGCLAFVDVRLVRPPLRTPSAGHHQIVNGQTLPIKVHVEGDDDDDFVPDPPPGDGSTSGRRGVVHFAAGPGEHEGTAEARYRLSGPSDPFGEVTVTIQGPDAGSISYGGLTIDGYGPLTGEEREALEALASSPLADALAMVPLDLACQEGADDLPPEVGAALLMPWQMLLKYLVPERLEVIHAYADRSVCSYFPSLDEPIEDRKPAPSPSIMMLSYETVIPLVYGHFPFDGEGQALTAEANLDRILREFEQVISLAVENEFGPGGSRCRGACGPDCPDTCTRTTRQQCAVRDGVEGVLTTTIHDCGTARAAANTTSVSMTARARILVATGTWVHATGTATSLPDETTACRIAIAGQGAMAPTTAGWSSSTRGRAPMDPRTSAPAHQATSASTAGASFPTRRPRRHPRRHRPHFRPPLRACPAATCTSTRSTVWPTTIKAWVSTCSWSLPSMTSSCRRDSSLGDPRPP
jgi:hypothetical protein